MLAYTLNDPIRELHSDGRLLLAALTFCIPVITFLVTSIKSSITIRSSKISEPPILPYWIPFVGNLIPFLRDVPGFAADVS